MVDREKLYQAIVKAIVPCAKETAPENLDEEDPLQDPFVIETATFLTQEILDSNIDITEDQEELDDQELENLPISNILTPHLEELLGADDPIRIISNIIEIYYTPEPEPEYHHLRNGPCEVSSPPSEGPRKYSDNA